VVEPLSASAGASRLMRIKRSMSPSEWRRAGGMAAVIVGLHVVGFGLLILVVAPAKYKLGAAGTSQLGPV
jgi:nickel/cobalt transporter (NiCoT) family protein